MVKGEIIPKWTEEKTELGNYPEKSSIVETGLGKGMVTTIK